MYSQQTFVEFKANMYTFSTLPIELVYRILDHLSDFTLFCSMQNVCQRFNQILNTYHRYQVSLQSALPIFSSVQAHMSLAISNLISSLKEKTNFTIPKQFP